LGQQRDNPQRQTSYAGGIGNNYCGGTNAGPAFIALPITPQAQIKFADVPNDKDDKSGEDMGLIAVTAVLTVVAFLQLLTMRDQTKATKAMQRAYIAVEPGGIREFDSKDGRIACDVIIINAGNMPARDVRWSLYKCYSKRSKRENFRHCDARAMVKNGIVLAPKGHARKGSKPTRKAPFDTARKGAKPDEAWLYVWGRIIYHDGFVGGRAIDFCHRYNLLGSVGYQIPAENGRHHEWGNRTFDVPAHNSPTIAIGG
jgi:hypothetical protein